MKTLEGPLPDYEHPPVIEVVCGIQYEPLTNFLVTAFGLFWEKIRDEYPTIEEMAPLPPVIESVSTSTVRQPNFKLLDTPPLPRLFFLRKDRNWLMQLQRDRFLHNWRKENDTDVYPHYPNVYGTFWKAWERFLAFLADENIALPTINQLEITYINHIPAGQGWENLSDLAKIFVDIGWAKADRFLPSPESIGVRLSFVLPESRGRLHISLKHAIRVSDNQPVLLCELTARGMPASNNDTAIKEWFDLGREWIVRGFTDITASIIQNELWGRKV